MNFFYTSSLRWLFAVALLVFIGSSCNNDEPNTIPTYKLAADYDNEVPLAWNKLFCELDRYAKGYRPGPAPRAAAYINLAAYEAMMNGMPDYNSLAHLYNGLAMPHADENEEYHWPTVVNAVYGTMMGRFFPADIILAEQPNLIARIGQLEEEFNNQFEAEVPENVFERSKLHGEAVANNIWEWSKTDQYGHEAFYNPRPSSYSPPQGQNLWQPTAPDYGAAMYPYWGKVRTFGITDSEKLAKPPLELTDSPNSLLFQQAKEVQLVVDNLSFTDQWIAEFWSDDQLGVALSPPSRWIYIAAEIVKEEEVSLEKAVFTFAKVSIALNDAGVACWYSKYIYNVERPVSYIQRNIDPNWFPHYLPFTPSFPAYPSGHSTFGAAAGEALSSIYGYSYKFTDYTHEGRQDFLGLPRSFKSINEAALENALSRIPLGVHFRMDCEEGYRQGIEIGRKVAEMPFKK